MALMFITLNAALDNVKFIHFIAVAIAALSANAVAHGIASQQPHA